MLTIYGVYRSRASRNIWMALELGIPFTVKPVVQAYRLLDRPPGLPPINTRSPEFLRLNPLGQIPVIEDDGVVLTESLAINLYLARKYGEKSGLGPKNLAEEGQMAMWALRGATEIESHALEVLLHRAELSPDERDEAVAMAAEAALRDRLPVVDAALAETGWLVGGRFTVADINLAEVLRYALPAKRLFDANPNLKRWIEACHARPAFQQMWKTRESEPA